MTPELKQSLKMSVTKMMMAAKNFFTSIAAIGRDDFEMYILEKEMKPTYRSSQNPYGGVFLA